MPEEGSQPSWTEKRKMPTRARKKPGTAEPEMVKRWASRSQTPLGFQAAITPSGTAMATASTTPVPVRRSEGQSRWTMRSVTSCP